MLKNKCGSHIFIRVMPLGNIYYMEINKDVFSYCSWTNFARQQQMTIYLLCVVFCGANRLTDAYLLYIYLVICEMMLNDLYINRRVLF